MILRRVSQITIRIAILNICSSTKGNTLFQDRYIGVFTSLPKTITSWSHFRWSIAFGDFPMRWSSAILNFMDIIKIEQTYKANKWRTNAAIPTKRAMVTNATLRTAIFYSLKEKKRRKISVCLAHLIIRISRGGTSRWLMTEGLNDIFNLSDYKSKYEILDDIHWIVEFISILFLSWLIWWTIRIGIVTTILQSTSWVFFSDLNTLVNNWQTCSQKWRCLFERDKLDRKIIDGWWIFSSLSKSNW